MIPQQTTQKRTYTVNGKPFGASHMGGLRERLEQAKARTELTDRFNQYMSAVHEQERVVSGDLFGREDYGLISRLQRSPQYNSRQTPERSVADYVVGAVVSAIEYLSTPIVELAYSRA